MIAESYMGYLDVPDDSWETSMGLLYLAYPFGYFRDGRQYRHIPDMLENMSVEEDGSSLVVLSCKTKEWELDIRLDRTKGWMADQIEYLRILLTDDPSQPSYLLYTVDHASNHDGVWIPDSFRCEESRPDGKQKLPPGVRIVDGAFVTVRGGADIGVDFIEKEKSSVVAEIALSDIHIGALDDSSFQLQTTVPNGLQAHMQDARDSVFRWLDGEIVLEK